MDQNGADILRLWVVSSDYYNDLRIGPEIIKRMTDNYRRFRNTLRYLLGALNGYSDLEAVDYDAMPELEKWILNRLAELDVKIRVMTERILISTVSSRSFMLFAIVICRLFTSKFTQGQALPLDAANSVERRACRTVMKQLFDRLTAWLAPILCFTAEDIRRNRVDDPENSVHLRSYDPPSNWANNSIAAVGTVSCGSVRVVMSAPE